MIRILYLINTIIPIGPLIRFRNHELRFFFFFTAVTDPLIVISSYFFNRPVIWIETYLVLNTILFFVLPKLKLKFKIGTLIVLVLFWFVDRSDVTLLIISFFLMLVIALYFAYRIYLNLKKTGYFFVYALPIVIMYLIGAATAYVYYSDIYLLTLTNTYRISIYILINLSILLAGPNFKIKLFESGQILDFEEYERIIKRLSPAEQKIFTFIINGKSNIEIAELSHIDKKTVETHLYNMKERLGLKSVNDLRKIADQIKKGEKSSKE